MDDIGSAGVASPEHRGHDGVDRELLRTHIRAAWVEAFEHDRFDDDDDFFDIGGHSLQAAGIMATLSALAGTRLSLRLFFDHPTVTELTDTLASLEAFGALAR